MTANGKKGYGSRKKGGGKNMIRTEPEVGQRRPTRQASRISLDEAAQMLGLDKVALQFVLRRRNAPVHSGDVVDLGLIEALRESDLVLEVRSLVERLGALSAEGPLTEEDLEILREGRPAPPWKR